MGSIPNAMTRRRLIEQFNRRYKSCIKLFDNLTAIYSKLIVLRIDLGYTISFRSSLTVDDVLRDLKRFHKNQKHNQLFQHIIASIVKIELGEEPNNYHIHMAIFLDGQKIKDNSAITLGNMIGEYWNTTITKGKGTYHTCNKHNYKEYGLGLMDTYDKKRILASKVFPYLCKSNTPLYDSKGNQIQVFRRSILKPLKSLGRPRISIQEPVLTLDKITSQLTREDSYLYLLATRILKEKDKKK